MLEPALQFPEHPPPSLVPLELLLQPCALSCSNLDALGTQEPPLAQALPLMDLMLAPMVTLEIPSKLASHTPWVPAL